MGIQKDAGELLVFCYKNQLKGKDTDGREFRAESGWDTIRALNAIQYLSDKRLVHGAISTDGEFFIEKLFPQGIDIIENEDKFKNTFGFTINLGLVSFSWEMKKE